MLDVSRDRVPTLDTIEWLLGILAEVGFTELQLYVEHTFTYSGHEVVWRNASPLTHADMTAIADSAAERGMKLVANMNGFGHMGRWLEHDEYRHRAECPDGAPALFGDGTMQPGCLAPNPENAELALSLAREMLAAVGGHGIHIGGDEPFELGEGASAEDVADRGRTRVYLDHLNAIIGSLVADGTEVMFWGDQFRQDAAIIEDIPDGATGVVWNYEAPGDSSMLAMLPADLVDRLALPGDAHLGFASHARLFIESGKPFWVAPGTSTWNTIIGRNRNAAANIADAVSIGSQYDADGLLLTDWGDNGHWQPLAVSLPSIVRAGAAASTGSGDAAFEVEVGPIIDDLLDAEAGTGQMIERLGGLGESLGMVGFNGSPIFAAINNGIVAFGDPDREALDAAMKTADDAIELFASQPIAGERGDIVAEEMVAACGLARLGLRRIAGDEPSAGDIEAALDAQREAWLRSSRPGGLDDSLAKFNYN